MSSVVALLIKRSLESQPPRVIKINTLLWAIHYGHASLVKTILSKPNLPRERGGIQDALHLAAELGHANIIPIFIPAGNGVDGTGLQLPLHLPAINGHASTVAKLLDHGADIHKKRNGLTALLCPIEAPWTKMAPKGISGEDNLQLLQTIEAGVITTIQVFLNRGAYCRLNAVDFDRNTPLLNAVTSYLGST